MSAEFVSASYPGLLNQVLNLFQRRPEVMSKAVNQVLSQDKELRWSLVIEMYLDEQISLGKAAELLGMHMLEARERFQALGIPLNIGSTDLAEAQAEVDAMRNWFSDISVKEI